jgi:uncharacterized membrane protein YphA (DoxX/SURF4 family)
MLKYSVITIITLVALRLAIGWHFLTEGYQKIHSRNLGETETNTPFTAEGYFKGSTGPLSKVATSYLGDPDEAALSKLQVKPLPEGKSASEVPLHTRMPDALDAEWNAYLDRYLSHHNLSGDDELVKAIRAKHQQAKDETVRWLLEGKKKVTRSVGKSTQEFDMSTPQRILEYKTKLATLKEVPRQRNLFLRNVNETEYRETQAEVGRLRTALVSDLEEQTKKMKQALADGHFSRAADFSVLHDESSQSHENLVALLTLADFKTQQFADRLPIKLRELWDRYPERLKEDAHLSDEEKKAVARQLNDFKEEVARKWVDGGESFPLKKQFETYKQKYDELKDLGQGASESPTYKALEKEVTGLSNDLYKSLQELTGNMTRAANSGLSDNLRTGQLPSVEKKNTVLTLLNRYLPWGLAVIGGCLMLGFLSRTMALLGALFLLSTYLFFPPFPWLPLPPQTEGNPIYVNKNVIEMLALLVLATTATGRWFGIDSLFSRDPAKAEAAGARQQQQEQELTVSR